MRYDTETKSAVPTLAAGAARVDIPTDALLGKSSAGYGPGAKRLTGVSPTTPLYARALVLDENSRNGARVVFCLFDLHTASRRLFEGVLKELGSGPVHLKSHELVIVGTHTHTGPAGYYGNTLYDTVSGNLSGPLDDVVRALIDAGVLAIRTALQNKIPAIAAWTESIVPGVAVQRSKDAFPFDRETWTAPGAPGHGLPDEISNIEEWAIDPRLRSLVIRTDEASQPIAVLSTFACHNTALGPGNIMDGDFFGRTMKECENALASTDRAPVVLLLPSCGADASPLPLDGLKGPKHARKYQGISLAEKHAAILARSIQEHVRSATVAERFEIDSWFLDWDPRSRSKHPLARWAAGASMIGGAEDGRSILSVLVPEGKCRKAGPAKPGDYQHPKLLVLGPVLQSILKWICDLELAPRHPIHVLRLGHHALATLPGEPTAAFGWGMSSVVKECIFGNSDATAGVIGYTGDYIGYLTTEAEYNKQHYEGASTLYGRNIFCQLAEKITQLLAGPSTTQSPYSAIASRSVPVRGFSDDLLFTRRVGMAVMAVYANPKSDNIELRFRSSGARAEDAVPDSFERWDTNLGTIYVAVFERAPRGTIVAISNSHVVKQKSVSGARTQR